VNVSNQNAFQFRIQVLLFFKVSKQEGLMMEPDLFNPSSFTQTLKRQSLFATATN